MPDAARNPWWWTAHDILVGLLAGFGVGVIAGLYSIRLVENNIMLLVGGVLGAAIGIYLMLRSRRRPGRFISVAVVVAWVLLVLSAVFLTLLAVAIANFE